MKWLARITLALLLGVVAVSVWVLVAVLVNAAERQRALRDIAQDQLELIRDNRRISVEIERQGDVLECLIVSIVEIQPEQRDPREILSDCESQFEPGDIAQPEGVTNP